MARARKPRHVLANLGEDHRGRRLTHARHRRHATDCRPERGEGLANPRFDVRGGGVERVNLRQMQLSRKR